LTLAAYRHTQTGWAVIAGSAAGLGLAAAVTMSLSSATIGAAPWLIVALFGVLCAGLLLYATLRVEVDADEIRARFGIGIIGKSVPLADVVRCDIVRTPVHWGWGMHWTPSGWLYNVGGRFAVRLEMKSQRPLMIGTNDAERLKAAIDTGLKSRGN
jgi:hypothetical protein